MKSIKFCWLLLLYYILILQIYCKNKSNNNDDIKRLSEGLTLFETL